MNERRWLYAGGGIALTVLNFARGVGNGFGTYDESWFLQVLNRVARGEVLYRDVFFGATPLSVQVMTPAIRAVGSEVVVVRAASATISAATSLACCRAVERLGIRDPWALALLALAVAIYASPDDARPPYSGLAALGQAVCLEATIAAEQVGGRHRHAALAGLAAGTSFAAKHNAGLATMGALSISLRRRPCCRPPAAVACAGFVAVVAASLAPVVRRGAGKRFLEYAITNKRRYLRMAGLPYLDGLGVLYRGGRGVPLRHRYSATKFLVPPITAVLLAGRAARARTSHERATAALVGAHGAASFLCAFPRADEEHVSWTLAPSLVGLTWASARLPLSSPTRHAARTIAWIWLGTAVVLSFAKPFRLWRSGRARLCRLPHFRGVVEDAATIAFVEQRANVLRTLAEDAAGATFLISPNAAQYWLLSGIPNPTPYDYPYATAFGHEGERETADAIRGGAITTAMIEVGDPHFAAWEVIRAAEETLTRVHDSDGTFYRGAKVSTPVLPRGQATAAR